MLQLWDVSHTQNYTCKVKTTVESTGGIGMQEGFGTLDPSIDLGTHVLKSNEKNLRAWEVSYEGR